VGAPSFTNTYYSGIIANYNSLIALAPPSVQLNINSDYVVDGDVYCSNLSVTGTVTISGKGRIICTGWARMPNGNGRVTIAPDSTIEIISANIIYMYCSNSNRRCTIKGNVTLYSQYYVYGYGRYCIIDNSTIMIDRHPSLTSLYVFFYNGATVTNSLIYASSSSRGVVIGGNNTVVGNTILNEGTYMYVYNRGTFNGLIYHNNSTASARAYIYTGTINGSLVRTHDFFSSYIRSSIINFNADLLPDPPPQGFENVVTLKPYSWNGW